MSARTRSISAADCAALVEKPPTSISISVTPSLRLENRVPSRADPPSSDEYFFSMSEKSSDGAGSLGSSSVPVSFAYSQCRRSSIRSRTAFRSSRSSSAAACPSTKARSAAKPVRTSLTSLRG